MKASERDSLRGGSTDLSAARSPAAVGLALLDRAGVIVSVNPAWAGFARASGGDPALTGVGSSYLEVCAQPAGDPLAEHLAEAVRSALRGRLPAPITVRIPGQAPGQHQWFNELISSRYTDTGDCAGATIARSPSARVTEPHRTTDDMLEHAVSRLVDAQSLLSTLEQRLSVEVDKLTLTATFENLDAVIRDLRPRQHWRHH